MVVAAAVGKVDGKAEPRRMVLAALLERARSGTTPRRWAVPFVVAGLFVATLAPASPSGAFHDGSDPAIEVTTGYVAVGERDSAGNQHQLAMDLARPSGVLGLPTLLLYSGYIHILPNGVAPLVKAGYAVMAFSPRGTGCSSGNWDFMSDQEARDASDVINWIASQPWSNGKVAMIGSSYVGWQQLGVASLVPPPKPLVAIAPASPITDIYRDIAYPGGIPNTAYGAVFTAFISALRANALRRSLEWIGEEHFQQCLQNQGGVANPAGTPAALFAMHPYDTGEIHQRSLNYDKDITLPTLTFIAWQDGTLGSRAVDRLSRISGPFHAVLSNGDHSASCSPRFGKELRAFLDFYVKGIDNGYSDRDRVQVWWETQRSVGGTPYSNDECLRDDREDDPRDDVPRWTSGLPAFPAPASRTRELFLSADGSLTPGVGTGAADTYMYVGGTGQHMGGCEGLGDADPTDVWSSPDPDKSLVYTSQPLDKDMAALGSGSLDLWVESSSVDTDVQAVLSEVRPDGQEVYVQAGWLRASHRAEDAKITTPTRPYHTHQLFDTRPLTPGTPALMRVELRPFGHVFRKGSQVRVWIEAPAQKFGCFALESLPGPALNKVHHDAQHPSVLRLATLPGHSAPVDYPVCGTVIRQPCRHDPRP